jgi:ribosome-associated toxin RatA of RatAB toxin-antitoxin module
MPQTQNKRPLKRYSALCLTLAALLCAQIASAESNALAQDGQKTHTAKVARTTVELVIKAPREVVWKKLTDFDNYPQLFPRVKSCQVLKRESESVYLESVLKPQLFVKQATQHTINDLGGSPNVLRWRMLDGNFKSAVGEWTLSPTDGGKYCKARYVPRNRSRSSNPAHNGVHGDKHGAKRNHGRRQASHRSGLCSHLSGTRPRICATDHWQ